MTESQLLMTRAEANALDAQFRAIAHKVANWLTVVKALSTLANDNPASYEKLFNMKLMKCPAFALELHEFADELSKRMNPLIPMPENAFLNRVLRVHQTSEQAVVAA